MTKDKAMDWIKQIDRNFIVEASAGTGKTYSLLERIVNLIEQDRKLRMRQLVAITFTDKAASELRTRLRKELGEKSVKFSSQKENPYKRALAEFEQAEISTIHSFCSRLLRMRPVEAKISPAFQILDPSGRDFLFEQTWENWLTKKIQEDEEFFKLLRRSGVKIDDLKALARSLFSARDLLDNARTEWKKLKSNISIEQAEKKFDKLYQRTKADAPNVIKLNRAIDEIKNLLENSADKERVFLQFKSKDLKRGTEWKPSPEATKINAELIEVFDQFRANVLARFLERLNDFLELVQSEKEKQEALDFEDLLFKTRDLLKHNPEARDYFKRRFKYILIDEFQDTDPVQVEIAFFLAEELNSSAKDWTKVKLEPGKLFLVGDPKQSLYRFRRADLRIYQRAKESIIKSSPEPLPVLKVNRRSHPGILKWVNYTFETRFNQENKDPGKDYQPGYESLEPYSTDWQMDKTLPRAVVIMELEGKDEKYNADGVRELEAEAVADFIQWAHSLPLKIWNQRTEKLEPVKFRDFAVLYPTNESASFVKTIFRMRDIPFQIAESDDFSLREEIAGLVSLLKTLINPLDNVSLLSALRSLFFAVSDAELFQFKFSSGTWNWLELDPEKIPVDSIKNAFKFLQELYAQRDRRSLSWLIEQAIEKSQLRKLKTLNNRFTQALLNLERIKAIARNLEQDPGFSLSDFINWLEISGGEDTKMPELLAEDAEDAITLSTIHKAKGLEFPIVIIINLCGKQHYGETGVIKDWEKHQLEIALSQYMTPGYLEKDSEEKRHKQCEYLRQFYVATTRAKNYLVLPDFRSLPQNDRNIKRYIDFILPGMPTEENKDHPLQNSIFRCKMSEFKIKQKTKPADRIKLFLSRKPADTELEREKELFGKEHQQKIESAKVYKEIKAPSQTDEIEYPRAETAFERKRAMDIGVIVHRVVELAAKENLEVGLKLAEILAKESCLEEELGEIKSLLENFWKSDLKKELDTLQVYQEVPFIFDDDSVIWRGKMDLIIREKDGLRLIDLKTDRITKDQIEPQNQKHKPQMNVYQKVLENLKKEKLLSAEIFYLKPELRSKL